VTSAVAAGAKAHGVTTLTNSKTKVGPWSNWLLRRRQRILCDDTFFLIGHGVSRFFGMNKLYARIALAAWFVMGSCVSLGTDVAQAQSSETRCVRTNQIRHTTRSSDGTFIDFHMTGRTVYRNTLRIRCPGLRNSTFRYRSRTGRLCRGDMIRVVRNGSTCVLGSFVNITPAR
jgi:hypothetical protein